MTNTRRVVVAIAALLGIWLVTPAVIPLYDVGFNSDEPYRYVNPPAGWRQNGPPTSASLTVSVRNGLSTSGFANSQETGPQISVYIPTGALKAPSGATTISVKATPSAPTAPLPADGTIVSDVYTITATAAGGAVTVVGNNDNTRPALQMRAPTAKQPGPVFEHLDNGKWTPAVTVRIGQDIYQTIATALGSWALVQHASTGGSGGGLGSAQIVMLVLGIGILVVVGVILLVRTTRARPAPAGSGTTGSKKKTTKATVTAKRR